MKVKYEPLTADGYKSFADSLAAVSEIMHAEPEASTVQTVLLTNHMNAQYFCEISLGILF